MTLGVSPTCHCGEPAVFALVLGATKILFEAVTLACWSHARYAADYSHLIGRPVSVFELPFSGPAVDVSRLFLGKCAERLAVR